MIWASHRWHWWTGKPIVSDSPQQVPIQNDPPTFEVGYVEEPSQALQLSMKKLVAGRVDKLVMIHQVGYYNQQETLPQGTVVMVGIAGSYCLTETALVERSDFPKRKLLDH